MKISLKTLALATFVGLAGIQAYAQSAFSASTGDLILGFNATSGTGANTYLQIDLGSVSYALTTSGSVGLGNLNSLLSSTYGSSWMTNSSLTYGIVAATGPAALNLGNGFTSSSFEGWTTKASSAAGATFGDWTQLNGGTSTATSRVLYNNVSQNIYGASAMNSTGGFASIGVGSGLGFAGATGNALVWSASSGQATWGDMLTPGSSNLDVFGGINGASAPLPLSSLGVVDGSSNPEGFDQSVTSANNYADLRQIIYGQTSSTLVGSFNLDSSGNLSFTAVPEPSTYGLIGAGALAGVAFVRRRRQRALLAA